MSRRNGLVATLFVLGSILVLASCSDVPDSGRATEVFADCLEQNGVEVQDLEVTLNTDGSVRSISATIISEGEVGYEPTVRMACTQEVKLNL